MDKIFRIIQTTLSRPSLLSAIILAFLFSPTTSFGNSKLRGLVGYWPFDEGSGTQLLPLFPQNNNILGQIPKGEILNPKWIKGKFNTALDFSSGQNTIEISKTRELSCQKQLSLSAWIYVKNQKDQGVIINNSEAYRLSINKSGKMRIYFQINLNGIWAGNWLTSKGSIPVDEWTHIAAVYDGKRRAIFINGKLDKEKASSGIIGKGKFFFIGARRIKQGPKSWNKWRVGNDFTIKEPFIGLIDEVKIWNRAISNTEINSSMKPITNEQITSATKDNAYLLNFYPITTVSMSSSKRPFTIQVFNRGHNTFADKLNLTIISSTGNTLFNHDYGVTVAEQQQKILVVPSESITPGISSLKVTWNGNELSDTSIYVMSPSKRKPVRDLRLNSILKIDLTKELGDNEFVDDGSSRIIHTKRGSYREAGSKKYSRFAVRLKLHNSGPHLVRVTYPDDKARTCEIMTSSTNQYGQYNVHSGYYTGMELPLSNKFQIFEFPMWPRETEQSLIFTTWLDNQPAAASSIEVFEINNSLPSRGASRSGNTRLIGQYWEDAQPLSRSYGGEAPTFNNFDQSIKRLCNYFDYSGQNLLMHPLVWYDGPIYNSLIESLSQKGGLDFPFDGFTDIILNRFEERDFKFYAGFNVHELSSLKKNMNTDMNSIQRGKPTFNTISKKNEILSETSHHKASLFNALHPKVQNAVVSLVKEIVDRYSYSPAFAGISFHLTMAQLLQPGSLDVSYDDWTVAEFERDTGIHPDVPKNHPKRFAKRYKWLMKNAHDEWVSWRCQMMTDYYRRIATLVQKVRPDLKFIVTLLEPPMSIVDKQRDEWLNGKNLVELCRESGIDPGLLSQIPGVILQRRVGPTALRKKLTLKQNQPINRIMAIRAMELDSAQQKAFKHNDDFGVFLYNRYFESNIGGRKRIHSKWFKNVNWRATGITASHDHFMEFFAQTMAMFNPSILAIGGFTPGTVGHAKDVEKFANIFRQLPVGKWQELTDLGDGLTGGVITTADKTYIYVVNVTPSPQTFSLQITKKMQALGESPSLSIGRNRSHASLGPYELGAWVK